jgi:hypothetical protein
MLDRRKTARMFLRIPITVKGVDAAGSPFTEEAATVEISRDGARIGLSTTPRAGTDVEITNLANNYTAIFQLTGPCPQSYDGLPEWGVALSAPMPDFWGIAFEEISMEDQPGIAALLTCQVCGRQEVVRITPAEYETLRTRTFLPRLCAGCRLVAKWEVGSPGEGTSGRPLPLQVTGGGVAPPAGADRAALAAGEKPPADEKTGAERRGARRLALKVPILVKLASGESEETETSDLSKTGLSFTCGLNLTLGESIHIVVGYGVAESAPAQSARVVWRRPDKKGVRALVGVKFVSAEEG